MQGKIDEVVALGCYVGKLCVRFHTTHESSHVLDLLITRKDCDFSLGPPIANYYMSDHSFVKCTINVENQSWK